MLSVFPTAFTDERSVFMKLLFKQRFLSWLGSYDIYGEAGEVLYTVKGKVGLGHRFNVYDSLGNQVGEINQVVFRVLPEYAITVGGQQLGSVKKKFHLFKQDYDIDYMGWYADGDFFGFDYAIYDVSGNQVASISKQLFKFTDTYVIDVLNPQNALYALMLTVAIDAERSGNGGVTASFGN